MNDIMEIFELRATSQEEEKKPDNYGTKKHLRININREIEIFVFYKIYWFRLWKIWLKVSNADLNFFFLCKLTFEIFPFPFIFKIALVLRHALHRHVYSLKQAKNIQSQCACVYMFFCCFQYRLVAVTS